MSFFQSIQMTTGLGDILDTSDSEAATSRSGNKINKKRPQFEHQSRHQLHQEDTTNMAVPGSRERSKSPRPQTLPGLVKSSDSKADESIPGLAQLAGNALLASPQVHDLK
jgi:hypothetical protein